jgi:DNA polymerase-1
VQGRASSAEATAADERRARSQARDWGRFTRNFVVQATAAEWALCWMAELRLRLLRLAEERGYERLESSPHLVYFLHDELMVHTPAQDADAVRLHIHEAARDAGRLLFGEFPVEFPVQSVIVDDYGTEDGDYRRDHYDR